jgi:hypothetical protein
MGKQQKLLTEKSISRQQPLLSSDRESNLVMSPHREEPDRHDGLKGKLLSV